jgi:hypothetical protein
VKAQVRGHIVREPDRIPLVAALSVPSPLVGEGNRIWKKSMRNTPRRAKSVERTQQPFAFRFWSVPDPIPLPTVVGHARCRLKPQTRLENFHMRFPCLVGEGQGGGCHTTCCFDLSGDDFHPLLSRERCHRTPLPGLPPSPTLPHKGGRSGLGARLVQHSQDARALRRLA